MILFTFIGEGAELGHLLNFLIVCGSLVVVFILGTISYFVLLSLCEIVSILA